MKIILPTDLSQESKDSLGKLKPVLKNKNVEIVLFHAMEPPATGTMLMMNVSDLVIQQAQTDLKEVAYHLQQELGDTAELRSEFRIGYFESSLMELAEEENPDLILLLSKSRTGIEKILLRKKALKVLGQLKQPFMVVPSGCTHLELNKLGVAVNHEEGLSEDSANKINKIKDFFNAESKAFHVDSLVEDDLSDYEDEKYRKVTKGFVDVVIDTDIVQGIVRWANQQNIDAVVSVTHPKNLFEKFFRASVTRALIKRNELAVLVITQ